jgi:hypothetical protein
MNVRWVVGALGAAGSEDGSIETEEEYLEVFMVVGGECALIRRGGDAMLLIDGALVPLSEWPMPPRSGDINEGENGPS